MTTWFAISDIAFMAHDKLSDHETFLAKEIVNSALTVHKNLGPGLLEKVYEVCLTHELRKRNIPVARQIDIAIQYDSLTFEEGLRLDMLVDNKVIVEVKSVETVNPVWNSQVLSHLKLTRLRLGYVINFHVPLIKDGIKRIIL